MSQVMERAPGAEAVEPQQRRSRWVVAVVAMVAVVALAIAGLGGWFAGRAGEDDGGGGLPRVINVGGQPLTDRQQEMLAVVDQLLVDYRANDADAIIATFTPRGEKVVVGLGTFRVDDGTLRTFLEGRNFASMELIEPIIIHENDVELVVSAAGAEWMNVFEFTTAGDVLVSSHVSFGP